MTRPTIHDNGTPPDALARAYEAAYDALNAAVTGPLRDCAPNPRDYNSGEEFDLAVAEHRARIGRIAAVMSEFDQLVRYCEGANHA